jgi:hypothetical protein
MPRARITLDPYHLLPALKDCLSVDGPDGYVNVCIAIRKVIHDPGITAVLDVRVYNNIVGDWLREWSSQYGDEQVEVRRMTARAALHERWGIEIPNLSDADIIRSGLLEEKVTPREGQSFENVVLEHCYHPFFAYAAFPDRYLAEFLNQANMVLWDKNANRPIVARVFRERLEQWGNKETGDARRSIIALLQKDWQGLRLALATFKLLKNYPQNLGEKILGDQAALFRRAQIDTEPLILDGLDLKKVSIEIEYYLAEIQEKIQNAEELSTLLDQLSGNLIEEFNFVESFFQDHADWVTSELVRHVERRFMPIRGSIASRLNHLRRLVAVSRPSAPDGSWNASQWLDWIAYAYMPYHRWLEVQRKYDEELAGYASAFADWYYQNYIDLKNSSPEAFAFSALYNDRSTFFDDDRIALVIILDNFNYSFFPELRRLFNQSEISLVSERPTFSLIPTATEIGKAAVLAVTGDLTDIQTRDYPTLITNTWEEMLRQRGKSSHYLANIGELQGLTKLDDQVYFLNYLPVDVILHESAKTYGQDHETRIQEVLRVLVSTISEFARRFKIEKQLVVYIISDHGSTSIAKDVVDVLDKKYYKGIADLQHHRYISISDEQFAKIPQMVEAQCYIIDRTKYKTFQNYLAARQYYRFANTDQDFYVHGGLTPEEVVVPFARFEFTPVEIISPTLRLVKNNFRYAVKSTVEFELGNPNAFTLENLSIRLRGIDTDEVFVESLNSKATTRIAFQTVFKREPGSENARDIVVRLRYECQERLLEPEDVKFIITLKGVMEVSDDVDF